MKLYSIGKQTQKLVTHARQHKGAITSIQILLKDQQAGSAGEDGQILIWDLTVSGKLTKLKLLAVNPGQSSGPVKSLSYSESSHVLISGADRKVTFWSLERQRAYRIIDAAYDGDVNSLAIAADQSVFAMSEESGEVKVFDFQSGHIQTVGVGHATNATAVAVAPNSKFVVSGDTSGGIFLWEL